MLILSQYCIILISVIFLTSGFSKFLSLSNFRSTLNQLGLHDFASRVVSIGFPILEIIISVSILTDSYSFYTQILIMILLALFFFFSIRTLLKKQTIKCNCFGNLVEENFGITTLIKIIIFAILDGFLLLNKAQLNLTNSVEIIIVFQTVIQLFLLYVLISSLFKYL
ncbi:MauE/DoxX family redox-associated membrane protein, partial [Paenibacillus alginolyticus]